ncbi:MAG: aldo/keto reductase [Flexilinea sp.]|nr:aldo/keto reductase [Flexilinea sp.]
MKNIRIIFLMLAVLFCRANVQAQENFSLGSSAGLYDPEAGTVILNSGYKMPVIGIHCISSSVAETEELVYTALQEGFRMIRVGTGMVNEEGAWKGIKKALEEKLITREEIFITAELNAAEIENPDNAIRNLLTRLELNYIDLILLRQSQYDRDAALWAAMEKANKAGTIHSLGLAGFSETMNLDLFLNNGAQTMPAAVQLSVYPYEQRQDMREQLSAYGAVMITDDPLGGNGEEQVLFADPAVSVAATWHQKTSAQVILRWQLQSGNVIMLTPEHISEISEYADIFDFSLEADEMQQINALDRQQRLTEFESVPVAPVEEWFK